MALHRSSIGSVNSEHTTMLAHSLLLPLFAIVAGSSFSVTAFPIQKVYQCFVSKILMSIQRVSLKRWPQRGGAMTPDYTRRSDAKDAP